MGCSLIAGRIRRPHDSVQNLPKENATVHIAFPGMLTSTWISSLTGDQPMALQGMQVFSVQMTCQLRVITSRHNFDGFDSYSRLQRLRRG